MVASCLVFSFLFKIPFNRSLCFLFVGQDGPVFFHGLLLLFFQDTLSLAFSLPSDILFCMLFRDTHTARFLHTSHCFSVHPFIILLHRDFIQNLQILYLILHYTIMNFLFQFSFQPLDSKWHKGWRENLRNPGCWVHENPETRRRRTFGLGSIVNNEYRSCFLCVSCSARTHIHACTTYTSLCILRHATWRYMHVRPWEMTCLHHEVLFIKYTRLWAKGYELLAYRCGGGNGSSEYKIGSHIGKKSFCLLM